MYTKINWAPLPTYLLAQSKVLFIDLKGHLSQDAVLTMKQNIAALTGQVHLEVEFETLLAVVEHLGA